MDKRGQELQIWLVNVKRPVVWATMIALDQDADERLKNAKMD